MLVIPPGLSEEEEALQKKFNKLKKKVRAGAQGAGRPGEGGHGGSAASRRRPGAYVSGGLTSIVRSWFEPPPLFCSVSRGIVVVPVALVPLTSWRVSPLES